VGAEDWLIHPDAKRLDDYWWYNERLSKRKRYLFMAAVGRRVVQLMTEPACVRAAEVCEEYAEGTVGIDAFFELCEHANNARIRSECQIAAVTAAHAFVVFLLDEGKLNECVEAALCAFGYEAAVRAGDLEPETTVPAWQALERYESFRSGCSAADQDFTGYCRDIFGTNPFRPIIPDEAWMTPNAVILAQTMYESRDFTAMPLLADLLEEAGCPADVSEHCRGPGPHFRGCWVVDLVLGKE
jgi:hypothetical protein